MKTMEHKFEIYRNEHALIAFYLKDFSDGKITKKEFITKVARMIKNTEDIIRD